MSIANKPGRMVDAHKVEWSFDYWVLWEHVTKKPNYCSTKTMPIDTKLGRVGWWLALKGRNLKVTWPSGLMTLTRTSDLWPLNLAGCWHQGRASVRKGLGRHRLLVSLIFKKKKNYKQFRYLTTPTPPAPLPPPQKKTIKQKQKKSKSQLAKF